MRRLVTLVPALLCSPSASTRPGPSCCRRWCSSFGIPFALIPVVAFTSRRDLMGNLVNRPATTAVASGITALVVALNLFLLWQLVA